MNIKRLAAVFWTTVAALAVCLCLTIFAKVSEHRTEEAMKKPPESVPTPAGLPQQ
jgi:hypothetical protein